MLSSKPEEDRVTNSLCKRKKPAIHDLINIIGITQQRAAVERRTGGEIKASQISVTGVFLVLTFKVALVRRAVASA